jgi:hypothetical protein
MGEQLLRLPFHCGYLLCIAEFSNLKSLQISQHLLNNLIVQILARYSKKKAGHNFCDIILPYHNYERIKIVARYHIPSASNSIFELL